MRDIILKYIIKQFKEDEDLNEITYDTPLIEGGYIDSFSMIGVLMFLEKTLNVKIPDKEVNPINFNSINSMVELIKKYK